MLLALVIVVVGVVWTPFVAYVWYKSGYAAGKLQVAQPLIVRRPLEEFKHDYVVVRRAAVERIADPYLPSFGEAHQMAVAEFRRALDDAR